MSISQADKEFLLNNITKTREKLSLYTIKAQLDFTLPTPKEIYEYLDDYVISQDRAKKILSVGAHNHYKRLMIFKEEGYDDKSRIEKTNLMLLGPTGSGKTYLVKKLAEMMKVPYYIADANNMTASGYVGKDVESVVDGLFQNARGNFDAAATGIVFIDEFDKICSKSDGGAGKRKDVGGFNGWDKIKSLLSNGCEKIRVGIKPDGKVIARENTKIFSTDGNEIGLVTSGTFGPSVNAPVAMGYVKFKYAKVGTPIFLEIRGKKYEGKVSELPFYKKSYVK